MAVTLRDVAAHAGVSFRTVSNVVNDYTHVSAAMRARVQASLDELGYRPNLLARSLRAGRTGILTLLVPDLTAPYFAELAHEVVEEASALGYTVMVDETGGDPERERSLLDTAARSSWVDGVLLSPLGLRTEDLLGLGGSVSVVLLGERTAPSALDHVGFDNVAAARAAVAHLLDGGRRRVVAVGGGTTPNDTTTRLRLQGYHEALEAAGLLATAHHLPTDDYDRALSAEAVSTGIDPRDPPDGVLCLSDDVAVGALRGLHDLGLRVPEDVAVVSFDDADLCRYLVPSLTSVRQDRAEIARAALELLLQRVEGGRAPAEDVEVPWRLVVRESSAPRT